jgi:hypothetical protein
MKILINEVKVRSVRGEENDCSVIAIMAVTGCTYKQAWEALRSAGRLKGEGASPLQIGLALKSLGWASMGFVPMNKVTLSKLVKNRSKGRVIAYTSNHAVAIKDGAIYNTWNIHGKTLILGFFDIKETA